MLEEHVALVTGTSSGLGRRFAVLLAEQGARVLLLPTIPYGTETNQMRFPLAMNLNPSTLGRVITDLVAMHVGGTVTIQAQAAGV